MGPAIKLGDEIEDMVTGFRGLAMAVTDWFNGCRRWGVQSRSLDKDGKLQEMQWFDEPQVRLVGSGLNQTAETGGPRPDPKR